MAGVGGIEKRSLAKGWGLSNGIRGGISGNLCIPTPWRTGEDTTGRRGTGGGQWSKGNVKYTNTIGYVLDHCLRVGQTIEKNINK